MDIVLSQLAKTYWGGWFLARKHPTEPLTEQQAKRRHSNGKLYTVVLSEGDQPYCYIDVRLEVGFVGVHFLDDKRRDYMTYFFEAENGTQLFLKEIWFRRFENDLERPVKKEHYCFAPNGDVDKEIYDYVDNFTETSRIVDVDVVPHWELIPQFGEYEGVARKDR